MRLYVWAAPYTVSYGSSLLMVVAGSLADARKIAKSKLAKAYSYGKYKQKLPAVELGKPTRTVKLPCAEWHHWEE